jgi:pimeloyl-ACP methyl ester carboxylesterase
MRWTRGLGGALVACVVVAGTVTAASTVPAAEKGERPAAPEKPARSGKSTERTPDQEKQLEFIRLGEQLKKAYGEKRYAEGVEVCRKMMEVWPEHPLGPYNLACGLARLGKKDEALAALAQAVDLGYGDVVHMQMDEDLASLRAEKPFAEIVDLAKINVRAGGGRYEKGEVIEGTKTIEGFPEGGLRWRIRMSPGATKEKPDRLIVWFHPMLVSMNKPVEALAPTFLKRGFAVLVFTHRVFTHWGGEDVPKVAKTLDDVAKIDGIDAKRPVLMGLGGGGQMALQLWSKSPGSYGGLMLSAAYPANMAGGVRLSPIPIPADEAVKQAPILVLLGDKDNGVKIWKDMELTFHRAAVPLTIRYVPNKGAVWLFENPQLDEVDKWLEQVAAGKRPSDPDPAAPGKKEMPSIKLPPDRPPAEKAPSGKTPAPKAPEAKAPAEKTPAEKAPAGKTPDAAEAKPKG